MVLAWFVTIPLSGIVAAIAYEVGHLLFDYILDTTSQIEVLKSHQQMG